MPKKKSWNEKLRECAEPKVFTMEKAFAGQPAGAKMAVLTPAIVRDYIVRIPRGQQRSVRQLRDECAQALGANVGCPTSSSIFVRIVAEAALEDLSVGVPVEGISPFWRAIEPGSPIEGRLSCGAKFLADRRAAETCEAAGSPA